MQMNTKTSETNLSAGTLHGRYGWWILPAAVFLASIALTQPPFIGDSIPYSDQITAVRNSTAAPGTLWEFGHILWRPLGFWLSGWVAPAIPNSMAWTPQLKVLRILVMLNEAAGLVGALLVYLLSLRLSRSLHAAAVVLVLYVWGDAALAYSQSGAPYMVALALLLAGLWWQVTARIPGAGAMLGSACLFCAAALLWFPFAIAIPAAACARRFISVSEKPEPEVSWGKCILCLVSCGGLLLAGIFAAAWLAGVRSVPDLTVWIVSAGHGMQQNRRAIRAVSGFSRLLIDLGQDGVVMKRLVLHDPYFPVSVLDAIRSSLWKVGVFYWFVAGLVWLVWRSPGRRALIPLAIAASAGAFAAVVVFEPSSPERLLPVLPFALIALASGWNAPWKRAPLVRAGIDVFALMLLVLNLPSFEWRHSAEYKQAETRLDDFRRRAKPADIMLVMTPWEPILRLTGRPFDSANRQGPILCYWVLDPIDKDAAEWRKTVARRILENWNENHDMWLSDSAFYSRPEASSLWVEGDNPTPHWRDVPVFFRTLQFDGQTSAQNWFLRIRRSQENREILSRE